MVPLSGHTESCICAASASSYEATAARPEGSNATVGACAEAADCRGNTGCLTHVVPSSHERAALTPKWFHALPPKPLTNFDIAVPYMRTLTEPLGSFSASLALRSDALTNPLATRWRDDHAALAAELTAGFGPRTNAPLSVGYAFQSKHRYGGCSIFGRQCEQGGPSASQDELRSTLTLLLAGRSYQEGVAAALAAAEPMAGADEAEEAVQKDAARTLLFLLRHPLRFAVSLSLAKDLRTAGS